MSSMLKIAAAAALVGLAGQASAASSLYAGGATLPALGYYGPTTVNPDNTPTSGSAFYYFVNTLSAGSTISYCQTGSGFGKRILNGSAPSGSVPPTVIASGACAPLPAPPTYSVTQTGFGAPSGQGYADFIGTDSPLSSGEVTTFNSQAANSSSPIFGRGSAVQLPAVVGSIALLYNLSGVSTQINLTNAQVCSIFNGSYTTWNQVNAAYPSTAITVVYRSEGSGTTFAFSNYLNRVCGSSFTVDQTFSNVITPPAGSSGATGNPGVTDKVVATNGAIGYTEAGNAKAAADVSPSDAINFATVNSKNPITNLPESAFTIPAAALLSSTAIGPVDPTTKRPTLVALSPANSCVLLVNPNHNNVSLGTGYPIIAVSYLGFSTAGNGTKAADLERAGYFLTESANYGAGKITSIDDAIATTGTGTTGYSSLNLATSPATAIAAVVKSTAQSCL
jgi:phosphate transport system substrate-binding protein